MPFDRLLRVIRLRLRSILSRAEVERELDEELHYHVERQIEANLASGMSSEEARRAALRAFGGLEQRKEECREARGLSSIENLSRDVRLALRQLRRQPAFGRRRRFARPWIGANTAIFQLLNALSLRTLPVRAPHELVEIRLTGDGRDGRHTGRNRQVSLPQYREFVNRQQAFASMLAFGDTRFNLAAAGEVRYVDGLWVSGSFFEMLGVAPAVGRLITPADDRPGCGASTVAVISHALWQSEFGGRADIVGQALPFRGLRVPIIGVTPPGFYGVEVGRQFGAALPLCASGYERSDHWWLAALGRLEPGWTRQAAEIHLARLMPVVQRETMPAYRPELATEYLRMGVEVVDASAGVSPLRQTYQRPLAILMFIAALVLLIASMNLANLLLARATTRRMEFAVRLALGGSRGRVLQQVLVESGVIALLGAVAALGVASLMSRSIPPLISTTVDRIHLDLSLDWMMYGFTAAVAMATGLVFGAAPAIRSRLPS